MQTTKIFFMAALALMTVACSNDDNDIQTPIQQPTEQLADNMITITAKLAPKTSVSGTRAVVDKATYIESKWAENEHLAILYSKGGNQMADARITAVDGTTGEATITFTVVDGTADDTDCTIIYPYSAAKEDKTGVKDNSTLLGAQDGTLNANLDVRVGAGKIQTTTPGLDVTTQPAAQYSIFKFTTQDLSSTDKTATQFKVSDNSGNVITTVTPTSSAFYVALPVLATGMYWFNATIDSKAYIAKATVSTATVAGKYYQTTVKMATIGDVILSDGKFAARSSTGTKVAMIAYLGSETGVAGYTHGLALALSDEASTMDWTTATGASGAAAHTPAAPTPMTSSWMLPSKDHWQKMFAANGGNEGSYTGLNTTITNAGGTTLQEDVVYWSSSESSPGDSAWLVLFNSSDAYAYFNPGYENNVYRVRACLAF